VHGHSLLTVSQAAQCLRDGRIIAYPTEAVYGLGCDPGNETAVRRLLALKNRPIEAGLILIADTFERFQSFIQPVSNEQKERAMAAWPGPVTWLFPRGDDAPGWLAGEHQTIALRISAHPVCRALCAAFNGAIVSTSANPGKADPARTVAQLEQYFSAALGGIVEGKLGGGVRPSEIRDLASGQVFREG
jgi:L-threonylcarbamoyladenylate synthase